MKRWLPGMIGSGYSMVWGGNDTRSSVRKQCKHHNMKTDAARCVYLCVCMCYPTGLWVMQYYLEPEGDLWQRQVTTPPHPMHTSLSPTPERKRRQQTGEIRSWGDKEHWWWDRGGEERGRGKKKSVEGWVDKDKRENRWRWECVCVWIRCLGGSSWLVVAVGVMLCHKLRN